MDNAPSSQEIEAIGERIADTAARIDAATHTLLTDLRAFDLAAGWHAQGALSCAHWFSWRIGLSLGPAREKVRVAHALATLPDIDSALAKGEIEAEPSPLPIQTDDTPALTTPRVCE